MYTWKERKKRRREALTQIKHLDEVKEAHNLDEEEMKGGGSRRGPQVGDGWR